MARTRQRVGGTEDWSCPLCTLLNTAEDDRCAACDNARTPVHQLQNSQPSEPPVAVATASDAEQVIRPAPGVFFSSLPRDQGDPGAAAAWRQEPRLVVNRRRGKLWRNATPGVERAGESEQAETGDTEQNAGFTAMNTSGEQGAEASDELHRAEDAVEPMAAVERGQESEEEEDAALDVEEPCFNLLGSGASLFAAPVVDNMVEDQCATDEMKSREYNEEIDAKDEVAVAASPPRYPGFMPASKVVIEEPMIDEKLADAGLHLSDSDEEEFKLLTRPKDCSWEDKWVCQICTSLNAQTAMECASCLCKRYQDNSGPKETPATSNLRWACHICLTLNAPALADCQMCLSTRKPDARASSGSSAERWTCSVCTTFNAPGTTRCEACARTREGEPKKTIQKRRECPVCTNINAPECTRCDLCDSALQPDDDFVDLCSSPSDRSSRYAVDEGDLENPYADLSQYNDYAAPDDVADPDDDYLEEISDNERPPISSSNSRPVIRRADLKEFEHFVCMEDLQRDYSCRINYSKMFAGQRSRKSYADRLDTRKTESRKRKRGGARKDARGASTATARGGKAARGGKKRKAAAAPRRASATSAKAPRAKRAKKNGAAARRASSVTANSPGINHYDDTAGADLGEDLSTMAWEGVGSAGYL